MTHAALTGQEPSLDGGKPDWFHDHGRKMTVTVLDLDSARLVISSNAAKLTIGPADISGDGTGPWLVVYEVKQSVAYDEVVRGRRIFDDDELAAAFGLMPMAEMGSLWLIRRYGGEAAVQGQFIRWRKFLNLPCPGTGHDGDPNISIHLKDEITVAVRRLLSTSPDWRG